MLERRTILRSAGASDADLVAKLASESAQAARIGLRGPTADDASGIAEAIRSGSANFFIVTTLEDRPVGLVEWRWVGQRIARCAHLGVMISDPELWALGYGAEAVDNAIEELFYTFDAHRVEFLTAISNHPVVSLLARGSGPVVDGILRDFIYADGRFEDAVMWSLLRAEFDEASQGLSDRVERRRVRDAEAERSSARLASYLDRAGTSAVRELLDAHRVDADEPQTPGLRLANVAGDLR